MNLDRNTPPPLLLARVAENLGAGVNSLQPGSWEIQLQSQARPICIDCEAGWITASIRVDPAALIKNWTVKADSADCLWRLIESQSCYLNAKFTLHSSEHGNAELVMRAEIPVASDESADNDVSWLTNVLQTLADPRLTDPHEVDYGSVIPERLRTELFDQGFVTAQSDSGPLVIEVPSADLIRRIRLSVMRDWLHVELPLGTGDAMRLRDPLCKATGLFLHRCAATIRLARPYCRTSLIPEADAEAEHFFGFETYLPLQATSVQLNHGLASLVTATQRYETEIENLATEAVLADAYLATNEGVMNALTTT